jgi:branched-subunit amino acid ABC-type transport system permease component
LLVPLAACAPSADPDELRLCRLTLPALNDPGTVIDVLRAGTGPGRRDIRIDYRIETPDGVTRQRFIICRFAPLQTGAERGTLVGIATERGPMADASLHFLRRYYLTDPTVQWNDPGPGATAARGAALSPARAFLAQQVLAALPLATIYGLIAAAYGLIFGLVGRLHFGFGEFAAMGGSAMVLGALAFTLWLFGPGVPGLMAGALVGIASAGLFGLVTGRLVVTPLRQASGQQVLIATIGLAMVLQEGLRLTQGAKTLWLPPVGHAPVTIAHAGSFDVTVTAVGLATTGIGLLGIALVIALMHLTRFGRDWRASAQDRLAASLFGVDESRLLRHTFLLASAMAGLAGALVVTLYGGIGFAGGMDLGLKALIAAVVGGMGSVTGAFLGGLAIALIEAFWSALAPIAGRDLALYLLLAAMLIWRPRGLRGPVLPRDRNRET